MLRRHAIASLYAAAAWEKEIIRRETDGAFFEGAHGGAVLVDRKSRRLIAAHAPELRRIGRAPGSTFKPLVLNALLERGRLHAGDSLSLPRRSAPTGPLLRLLASAVPRSA